MCPTDRSKISIAWQLHKHAENQQKGGQQQDEQLGWQLGEQDGEDQLFVLPAASRLVCQLRQGHCRRRRYVQVDVKGIVSWDRFGKCWRKLTDLGLNKARGWFLNFSDAPLIFSWNKIKFLHYIKSSEPPKNFLKNHPHPLLRPGSVNFCQNCWNLSHETVLLNGQRRFLPSPSSDNRLESYQYASCYKCGNKNKMLLLLF